MRITPFSQTGTYTYVLCFDGIASDRKRCSLDAMPELHVQFSQKTDIVLEFRGLNVGHEGKGFRLANCLFFCILRDIKIWGHLASVSITGYNFQVSFPDQRKLPRVRVSYSAAEVFKDSCKV